MDITSIVFYILAIIIIASAIMMVKSKNLVHSALFIILTFIGIAGIYILLNADFLAMVQIFIYVGAISVLMVFGVMLTRRGDISKSNLFNKYKYIALLVVGSLFALVLFAIIMLNSSVFKISESAPPESTVAPIANLLLNEYVIPFEIAGLLLLIAMVGAIIIGKGVNKTK
jgi:NADH:ubiquinone oxidoreductase subunit 6 (subunit J)